MSAANLMQRHLHRKARLWAELQTLDQEWFGIDARMTAEAAAGTLSHSSAGCVALQRWMRRVDAVMKRESRLRREMQRTVELIDLARPEGRL